MIETLLNYGEDAKSSQLSMSLFFKDTPGKMDAVNPVADDDDANQGLKARYTFTKNSNTMDMMGPIHIDIFFQDRLILNGVNLRLKLNRLLSLTSPPELLSRLLSQKQSFMFAKLRWPLLLRWDTRLH